MLLPLMIVLVKIEGLEMAIACLHSFCSIEKLRVVLDSGIDRSEGDADIEAPEVEADELEVARLYIVIYLVAEKHKKASNWHMETSKRVTFDPVCEEKVKAVQFETLLDSKQ
ncbi:hypothetical protein BBJ28_00026118 [Nothophytophthora sp. Chile5]|nr:hypothetical protein BBJ28_00026118 [Nothophytophthora sp. Chile5]